MGLVSMESDAKFHVNEQVCRTNESKEEIQRVSIKLPDEI